MDTDRKDTTAAGAARELASRWEHAWNAHAMASLDGIVADDADWISVLGAHWKGRANVERIHDELHRHALRGTAWHTRSVHTQPISPGTALTHVRWTIEGATAADGTALPPREGVFSWLLVETDAGWRIRAAQGTNVAG